jgi:hypothetical protein
MRDKGNIKKKGYLKIHIAIVDVKSKNILFIKVTDEHVHDIKDLPELVNCIIKSNNVAVGKLFADGTYDGNNIVDIGQTMESIF